MARTEPQQSSANQSRQALGTVLLVEDDLVSASALKSILTRFGWETTVAMNLSEARSHLARNVFDWIILDLMLPDGNGAALLRQLKESRDTARVIVATAVSDPHLLDEVKRLNPHAFLQKPLPLPELLAILQPK
jgi:two-component system, OmpR family, response regulator